MVDEPSIRPRERREAPALFGLRVAWVMSRFPRLTETFVLREILAAEGLGVSADVYPLWRERAALMHPEARAVLGRVRYLPLMSWEILRSQLYWLRRFPGRYLGALQALVRGTWGSLNFMAGGLILFPKVAHAARLMQRDGVAHVHCHFANHPALAGFVIHRLTGIPFSFTAHAFDIYVDRHMLPQKVGEAAFVVAISEHGRRAILDECGQEHGDKVEVIHCGVDTEMYFPSAERRDATRLSILCIGRLAPWKGQIVLIEACRLLAARGMDFACRIVGGAGDRHDLERRVADAGLRQAIELLDWKTQAEIAGLMRQTDVLVAPSVVMPSGKGEGIPVTLMEAMASGVAVVASKLHGIPELVTDDLTGLLVAPGDPGALADALERLSASPDLRERLGKAGRRRVLEEFELRSNVAEVVRHIKAAALEP